MTSSSLSGGGTDTGGKVGGSEDVEAGHVNVGCGGMTMVLSR